MMFVWEQGTEMLSASINRSGPGDPVLRELARVSSALLSRWGLSGAEQAELLGLAVWQRKWIPQFRRGYRALPDRRDVVDRSRYLITIHGGLRLLFPEDEGLRFDWIKRRNAQLGGHSPLEVMRSEGFLGVAKVARFVESQVGQ